MPGSESSIMEEGGGVGFLVGGLDCVYFSTALKYTD